jgi:carbonic anhydrase
MHFRTLLAISTLLPNILSCPSHTNGERTNLQGRQTQSNTTKPPNDWAYEASFNWNRINPSYALCQTGTQQSPIALSLNNGLSLNHVPTFNYTGLVSGNFYNWGFGPAFTVHHTADWTTHPSFSYDNTTVYLKGWHIHTPADHSVGGDRSKAELHLVHVDSTGHEAAVLAIRLDPGNADTPFFSQLPDMIGFADTQTLEPIRVDMNAALNAVQHFNEFWTYRGSLTSPPCTEGIRWFVARQIMWLGVGQMQGVLGASTYSARMEQEVWMHRINE